MRKTTEDNDIQAVTSHGHQIHKNNLMQNTFDKQLYLANLPCQYVAMFNVIE